MSTLGDELPKEIARVTEILGYYKTVGIPGLFGATMIERSISYAIEALAKGDINEMIIAYKDLQEIEG